jgi:hypothetical protein
MAPPFDTAPYDYQSATLLAQQPPTAPNLTKQRGSIDWIDIYSHLETRLNGLRSWRWSWWSHWARLAEFLLPRRYHWFVVANRMSRGGVINLAIIDGTPMQALQICAAGLWSGLTSPSRPWFKLGLALPWIELDQAGKEWLEDTEKRLYTVLSQSNFYSTMAQAFMDVVVFGTAPVIINENADSVILCYLPCAGEYFLQVGSTFKVDVLYREFTLTVAQLVEMFQLENCPQEVQVMWQNGGANLDHEYVIGHAIEPNSPILKRGKQGGKIDIVPAGFSYREVYWVRGLGEDAELARKGYHERPFMAARWSKVSNDAYGRSPGMDALGDAAQLQQETRRKGEMIEKGVRPPMGADPELKNQPASTIPGNITYVDSTQGKKGFWPLFEPEAAWLAALTADIEKVSDRIRKFFFVDIFMAITNMAGVQPRNELELTKRDLERLQVLGPFINLFEEEFASPFIERTLNIMDRRRLLKPRPASLAKAPLKVSYISIMKLAQASAQQVALKDLLQVGGELSEAATAAQLPNPLRVINLDKAIRDYAELANVDPNVMLTDDEVKQHDQQQAQAHQQAAMPAQALTAVHAAQVLSNTPTGPGTALSALTGGKLGGAKAA